MDASNLSEEQTAQLAEAMRLLDQVRELLVSNRPGDALETLSKARAAVNCVRAGERLDFRVE